MSNVLIGWPNRIDSGTLSAGSWLSGLPLTNLQDRALAKVARSTNATTASTKFQLDLGQARTLYAFGLVNHNLSLAATWRIKLGTTAGASDLYDSSGQGAWAMAFDNDMLEWESQNWWEGPLADVYIRSPFAVLWVMPASITARYVTIEITDTTNADGYVQIGRVFVGGGITPTYNMGYGGMGDAWEDPSVIESTPGGAEFYDLRRRFRSVQFSLEWVTNTEFKQLYEMQRRQGTTQEVLYIPDRSDYEAMQRMGFLGRLRQLNAIEYPFYNMRKAAFEIKEIL